MIYKAQKIKWFFFRSIYISNILGNTTQNLILKFNLKKKGIDKLFTIMYLYFKGSKTKKLSALKKRRVKSVKIINYDLTP